MVIEKLNMKSKKLKHLSLSVLMALAFAGTGCANTVESTEKSTNETPKLTTAMDFLHAVVLPENGIGAREAGTEKEQKTADFIYKQFELMGYSPQVHKFKHPVLKKKDQFLHSSNIYAEKKGKSPEVLVLGAHFDSTGSEKGSQGAMDNGAGLSVMLSVASYIAELEEVPFTIRFMAFGAEEIGKVGSRAYLRDIKKQDGEVAKITGMVNLDTVAGGDFLYVHSAHSMPYKCGGNNDNYNFETQMREGVLEASIKVLGDKAHKIHPPFPGYPEGETGEWSDHEPFSCNGVPIAYIETTNFQINGKDGYDGYSQSIKPGLWDCFDAENVTACDRKKETQWGRIWHSGNDRLTHLQAIFPGRVQEQLKSNVAVLNEFFSKADKYL